jgi:hypothetical protein
MKLALLALLLGLLASSSAGWSRLMQGWARADQDLSAQGRHRLDFSLRR